jgi:two-component system OmpR family sensor kinase/two-component system sensor histidine kinase QseC
VRVDGDRAGLLALVRNLADNAVRHSPAGARVDVRVAVQQGRAELLVDDSGPGIPLHERERVFGRFQRRDDADDGAGSGLGLAIAANVARGHGATLQLGDSPLGGLRVRLSIPLARDPA